AAPDPRPDPLPPLAPEALSAWAALAPASRAGSDGTAVAAADGAGMAAVLVLTNGAGCGDAVPGLGVVPNNLLGEVAPDLSAPGARDVELPETWVPGRRLAAALAPALVEWPDGTVAALGAAGGVGFTGAGAGGDGAGARAALACALAGLVDRREPLDIALAAPRIDAAAVADPAARHRPPPALRFEDDLPERARDALLAAFPEAEPVPAGLPVFGAVHAVRRAPSGAVEAAGDPRRDGRALTG
ncbi:MAG: gamma-glutamyltransferase, partial [Pseudomonadota bacterium]|nr:gamma-glutamyltransferase [Pseudomonadota bacterium]